MTVAIIFATAGFVLGLLLAVTAHWKLRATATEWLGSVREYFVPAAPPPGEATAPIDRMSTEDTNDLVRWTRELGRMGEDPAWMPELVKRAREAPLPAHHEPPPNWMNTVPLLRALKEIPSVAGQVPRARLLSVALIGALCGWFLARADYTLSQGVVVAVVVFFMGVAALVDMDSKYLPDDLTLPLLWAGLVVNCGMVATVVPPLVLVAPPGLMESMPAGRITPAECLLGAVFGYLSLWLLNWTYKLVTLRDGMGYGDFKLLASIGAWVGAGNLLQVIMVAAFIGSVVGIVLMVRHGRDSKYAIPFGPYLAGSAILFLCTTAYLPLFAGLISAGQWPLLAAPTR